MWWPYNLVQVSLFRALHEKEVRPKHGLTRNQFFLVAFICSFAYYVFPGYLFSMLTSFSWICWIFPGSVLAQQLGSGLYGLGIGAIGLDWSTISAYLGSPLASPWFATANVAAGFVIIMYVITPIAYWLDLYDAKTFPIFSDELFTSTGQEYNISSIIDSDFQLDVEAYEKEGPLYLSTFFAVTYGVGFASLTATVFHVLLFHGREIWQMSKSAFQEKKIDVHTRLMRKYTQVPEWWFICILVANVALTIFACEYYIDQLQLPWWGVLLACGLAIFFTLPIGIITATTNQTPGLNIITEYLMGYLYPGRPVANMCFKVYGYISMTQALTFLQDFKLGHYMKIPPRTMFMAQVVGTLIAAIVYLGTAWWLMDTIPDICNTELLSSDSPWTCPADHVFYDASVIWGLIGPRRIFGDLGTYSAINWFFLVGAIAPLLVWLAHKAFPNQNWIRLINMPVLIGATGMMPPATAVNYTTWIIVGFLSGYVVYRYRRDWWQRHNYVLSGALDAGLAFMAVLLYLCLGLEDVSLNWWGNDLDGCPLASCPTAKGVVVDGCHEHSNNLDKHILPRNDGTSQWHGYNIQTPDLNEAFFPNDHIEGLTAIPSQIDFVGTADEVASPELVESAQAPSTPGLMEETLSAAAQESPALSPQRKTSPVTGEEAVKSDKPSSHFGCPDSTTESGGIQAVIMDCEPANTVPLTSLPTSSGFVAAAVEPQSECGQKSADNLQNDIVCDEVEDVIVASQIHDDGDAMLPAVAPLDGLVSVVNTEVTIMASKLSTENIPESSVTIATKSTSREDNAEPSVLSKQDYKEDFDYCPNSRASALNIDTNSQLNQASSLTAEDEVLVESIPDFSQQDLGGCSGTPLRKETLNVSESSFDLQGEDVNVANATNTNVEMHQQSGHALLESILGVSKPNEQSTGPISKDTQLYQFNCSSSSEFPEPEKMLLAPAGNANQASELGQLTAEKGVIESDGSVNRISSLCGKKRRLMESTPVLQHGTSTKMSGKSRIRRNTDYIPDDDDLLASILVGKRTPLLRIGPTPPPPKAASQKRPRLTTRRGMAKRKVLLDDTTVLLADAIRQQLINAEDIRRLRKKAPCTRPEIWLIEKSLLADEIFNESIITGVSVELNTLHNGRYDSEIDESHSHADPSKEAELSRSSEFVRETSGKEMADSIPVMPNKTDFETQGQSGTSVAVEAQLNQDSSEYDAQEHLGSLTDLPQPDLSNNNQSWAITMMENTMQDENAEVHMSTPATDCGAEDTVVHKNEGTSPFSENIDDICMHSEQQALHGLIQTTSELSEMNNEALQITESNSVVGLDLAEAETRDASVMAGNGGMNCPHDSHADAGKNEQTETLVSIQDNSLLEVETLQGKDDGLDARVEDGAVMQENLNNEVNSCQPNTEVENVPSAVGENSGLQELNAEGGMDVESAPPDLGAAKECSDFGSAVDGNDTEFLNVDDEANYDDAADHDMLNPEEAQSVENSGWSSRTRGVARYLRILFDDESGRGRKNVAMDHLLAGKTRKEASRMFFETLVLKTRDYIHVEQENPLECISIKPTIKLLKSEF